MGCLTLNIKKCEQKGCTTQSSFNYLGKKQGIFCDDHKKEGMVNVTPGDVWKTVAIHNPYLITRVRNKGSIVRTI